MFSVCQFYVQTTVLLTRIALLRKEKDRTYQHQSAEFKTRIIYDQVLTCSGMGYFAQLLSLKSFSGRAASPASRLASGYALLPSVGASQDKACLVSTSHPLRGSYYPSRKITS